MQRLYALNHKMYKKNRPREEKVVYLAPPPVQAIAPTPHPQYDTYIDRLRRSLQ
jgi:hypothetical protein